MMIVLMIMIIVTLSPRGLGALTVNQMRADVPSPKHDDG
jgi:hypothetical protein